jgi:hypothetical protein
VAAPDVKVINEVHPAPVTVRTERAKSVKVKRDADGKITGLETA